VSDTSSDSSSPVGSAGRISASLVEGIHLRLELFALEMGQERGRVIELVILCVVMALAAFLLLLAINVALLVVFWESHRVQIAVGMVVFYALVLVVGLLLFRRRKNSHDAPFTAIHRVLNQDIEGLRDLAKPEA